MNLGQEPPIEGMGASRQGGGARAIEDSPVEKIVEYSGSLADGKAEPNSNLTATKQVSIEVNESDDFILFEDLEPNTLRVQTGYELIAGIARGGMGVVYRARDLDLGREVAIKVLRREHYNKPAIVQRFVSEAQIMSFLQHPGVAPVYGCGKCPDGRPFHAMKLVQGNTLADLLQQRASKRDDTAAMLAIFSRVCQTLAYTHSRGIIHLDLKPSNVMAGAFGEVHLMDWGLARPLPVSDSSRWPGAGSVAGPEEFGVYHDSAAASENQALGHTVGTPGYMSPEQARAGLLDTRSDVFGLGAILCEILTGQPPYRGTRARTVFLRAARASLRETLRVLEQCAADRFLIQLTKKCLAARPEDRPADAGEIAKELTVYQMSTAGAPPAVDI